MKIPFTDLNAQHKEIRNQIDQAVKRTIKRGDFILGKDVKLFEEEFAGFCHTRYALGVSSGTDALFLALLSLGIEKGDEVIVPDFTYIATALAVSYTGARPVFVDIDEKTYNIDVEKIEKAITKNTRAIIPVHLYGQPANMPEIITIARRYKLRIIEDAAQAHGASIKMPNGQSRIAGGIGDIGCFSFYPTKNLGALGDGGIIVTNETKIYNKLCLLRDYGRLSKYEHIVIGYNCRLDTLQAAILRAKLKRLAAWNKLRQQAARLYDEALKDVRGIVTPYVSNFAEHVYHVYAVRTSQRDQVYQKLKDKGISVLLHYPIPLHLQKAYKDLGYKKGDFPVSERVSQEIISLPMYPHLNRHQINYITDNIKRIKS
ncbi:MAG: DegT/DnrJ/EryC1/StrS family aminotransferase [Candidatus Omnitrophota bacterium]